MVVGDCLQKFPIQLIKSRKTVINGVFRNQMNNLDLLGKNKLGKIKFMLHYSQKEFTAPVLCKILAKIKNGKNKVKRAMKSS